uniref:Secreted protein n=1 Tax=Heterorhabditis bacteriophora TaxID=37862 RepID=A0A1I7X5V6_HETBA
MRQIYGYLTIMFCYCVSVYSSEGVSITNCTGDFYNSVYRFGAAFLSNNGGSLARGPLDYVRKQRTRRHVTCGKSQPGRKSRESLSYEQRAICQYKHALNIDKNVRLYLLEGMLESTCRDLVTLITHSTTLLSNVSLRMSHRPWLAPVPAFGGFTNGEGTWRTGVAQSADGDITKKASEKLGPTN